MSRVPKIMLGLMVINAVASALFLTDIVDVSDYPGLYVTFPLAGVFYCLFLMTHMLEKEVAKFDAEQRAHHTHDVPDNESEPVESLHGHEHHQPMRA